MMEEYGPMQAWIQVKDAMLSFGLMTKHLMDERVMEESGGWGNGWKINPVYTSSHLYLCRDYSHHNSTIKLLPAPIHIPSRLLRCHYIAFAPTSQKL